MADEWNSRYGGEGWFYGTQPNDFLKQNVDRLPSGGVVLCLAEGEGRNAVFLAERGFRVTGVDQSAVGLEKARRLAANRGVTIETVCATLDAYTIAPGAWDGIVSIWGHLPPALRRQVHRQVVDGLRPGGLLLLEGYTPAQVGRGTGGPPVIELMMSLSDLQTELAGLELLHAVEIERDVHEGLGHLGLSAVVQVVAKKPMR